MSIKIDLKDIRFVSILAEVQSVTIAADKLGCVQSNVSNRIKRLERDLGFVLFTREGGRMVASPAAEPIAKAGSVIETTIQDALIEARHRSMGSTIIRLGVMESFAATHLARIMKGFPGIEVLPFTGPSVEIASRIRRNQLDFGVVAHVVPTSELQVATVLNQEFMIAEARETPKTPVARVAALRGIDPLLRSQIIEIVARQTGRIPTVNELGSLDAIVNMVRSGLACAVLPASFLKSINQDELSISPVPSDQLSQSISCIRHVDNTMDSAWDTLSALAGEDAQFS
ncbi:LysR family transcriptional regulator [Sagittula sp. NFXS13]|uniref:LysR family transcriptional regulator n=1 Tax=Sagittula sp. NFXS13 TaxID=2819095 RepID=UPI0032DED3E1